MSRQKSNSANPGQPSRTPAKASQTHRSAAKTGLIPSSVEKPGWTDNQTTTNLSPPTQTKPGRKNNSNPARTGRRYRTGEYAKSRHQLVVKLGPSKLVMEEVTILKRGEGMTPAPTVVDRKADEAEESDGCDDLKVCTKDKLGLEPEILPKKLIRLTDSKPVYAGTGFWWSPSPRSLPIPTFFAKQDMMTGRADLVAKGLQYLLRLDVH